MELWIRTQSKQSLIKVNEISINEQYKGRYNIDSGDWILGRYEKYERALEILDEIESILMYEFLEKYSGNAVIKVESGIAIYEMPKE